MGVRSSPLRARVELRFDYSNEVYLALAPPGKLVAHKFKYLTVVIKVLPVEKVV